MSTVAQTAVPIHARKLAQAGDGRALLAIPDARLDIPRLIKGKPRTKYFVYTDYVSRDAATDLGSRKAVAAAKAIVIARQARRAARVIAEAARMSRPGQFAAKVETKRQAAEAKRRDEIKFAVDVLLDRNYRCATSSWAGGETDNVVLFSDTPSARADMQKVWSKNKKWSGQNLDRVVTVSPAWSRDVDAQGLSVVDGMLTTHATPIESPDRSIELYRASWISQGRGMGLHAETGIIARHTASGMTYHSTAREKNETDISQPGKTTELVYLPCPKAAASALRRKMTAQGIAPEVRDARRQAAATARAAKQATGIARMVARFTKWDFADIQHVVVEREHSLKAGNCVDGTDGFIHRFFPDRTEPRATIGEIASRLGTLNPAKLAGADLTLARQLCAACLVAVRRDKQARRALMV